MPKEIKVLNNFSGGINAEVDPRDIQDNEVSSESKIEGYDDKGGQFAKLYNAEVDNAGIIRVSGGASSQNVLNDIQNISFHWGINNIADGMKAFSTSLDLSINSHFNSSQNAANSFIDEFNTYNIDSTEDSGWDTSSGDSSHIMHDGDGGSTHKVATLNFVDGTDTYGELTSSNNEILQAKVSNPYTSVVGTSDTSTSNSKGLNETPSNLGYVTKNNLSFGTNNDYTLKFKMLFNKWPVFGESYPPWLEIWNDEVEYNGYTGLCLTPQGWQSGTSEDVYSNVGKGLSPSTFDYNGTFHYGSSELLDDNYSGATPRIQWSNLGFYDYPYEFDNSVGSADNGITTTLGQQIYGGSEDEYMRNGGDANGWSQVAYVHGYNYWSNNNPKYGQIQSTFNNSWSFGYWDIPSWLSIDGLLHDLHTFNGNANQGQSLTEVHDNRNWISHPTPPLTIAIPDRKNNNDSIDIWKDSGVDANNNFFQNYESKISSYAWQYQDANNTRKLNDSFDAQFNGNHRSYSYDVKGTWCHNDALTSMGQNHDNNSLTGYDGAFVSEFLIAESKFQNSNEINSIEMNPILNNISIPAEILGDSVPQNGVLMQKCYQYLSNSNDENNHCVYIYIPNTYKLSVGDNIHLVNPGMISPSPLSPSLAFKNKNFQGSPLSWLGGFPALILEEEINYTVNSESVPNYQGSEFTSNRYKLRLPKNFLKKGLKESHQTTLIEGQTYNENTFGAMSYNMMSSRSIKNDWWEFNPSDEFPNSALYPKIRMQQGLGNISSEFCKNEDSIKPLFNFLLPSGQEEIYFNINVTDLLKTSNFNGFIDSLGTWDTRFKYKTLNLSNLTLFKSGINLQQLATVDRMSNTNPYKYSEELRDYQFNFQIPNGVKGNLNNWNIRINLGHAAFPKYDFQFLSQQHTNMDEWSVYLQDIELYNQSSDSTSSSNQDSGFTSFYTIQKSDGNTVNTSSTKLLANQNNVTSFVYEWGNTESIQLAYYYASGRLFMSHENSSSVVNMDATYPAEQAYQEFSVPQVVHTGTHAGQTGIVPLDSVGSQTSSIDYSNPLYIIQNESYNPSASDRRTFYKSCVGMQEVGWNGNTSPHPTYPWKDYYGSGENVGTPAGRTSANVRGKNMFGLFQDTQTNIASSYAEGGWFHPKVNDYHNLIQGSQIFVQNKDNMLPFWSYNDHRHSWMRTTTDYINWAHTRQRRFTTIAKSALYNNLKNDVAKVEFGVLEMHGGYKTHDRWDNPDYGNVAAFTGLNYELDLYLSNSVSSRDYNDTYWVPNAHNFENIGASLITKTREWDSNPNSKQWKDLTQMIQDPSQYMSDSAQNFSNYGSTRGRYYNAWNFDFGDWQITHNENAQTMALDSYFDMRPLLTYFQNMTGYEPYQLYQNGLGPFHGGWALWGIEYMRLYSYTQETTTMPSVGDFTNSKINLSFDGTAGTGWDSTWTWSLSGVNHQGEESALYSFVDSVGATNATAQCNLHFHVKEAIANKVDLHKIKIYAKREDSEIYYLQATVDLVGTSNFISSSTANVRRSSSYNSAGTYYSFELPLEDMTQPNQVDSYESETQISTKYNNWKYFYPENFNTAVVVNNRVYAGNVKYDGTWYRDRMVKSPLGKYGQLPFQNYIDVATQDGDEIIHLDYHKDMLFQFKRKKVFIINLSEEYEYLQDTFEDIGVSDSSQVCKTKDGIYWINPRGCFFYNGEELVNLIQGKIPSKENTGDFSKNLINNDVKWDINEDNYPSIGYISKHNKLVIFSSTLKSDSKIEGYIYNVNTSSWSMFYDRIGKDSRKSNFFNDSYGNLSWIEQKENQVGVIRKWSSQSVATNESENDATEEGKQFKIVTKDFDFGNSGLRKKIYKVYITYKSMDSEGVATASNIKVLYAKNGIGNPSTSNIGSGNWTEFSDSSTNYQASEGLAGTNEWAKAELLFTNTSDVKDVYSLQLKLEIRETSTAGSIVPAGFAINNIEIVYKNKRAK